MWCDAPCTADGRWKVNQFPTGQLKSERGLDTDQRRRS